jgi:hypothetical protein
MAPKAPVLLLTSPPSTPQPGPGVGEREPAERDGKARTGRARARPGAGRRRDPCGRTIHADRARSRSTRPAETTEPKSGARLAGGTIRGAGDSVEGVNAA